MEIVVAHQERAVLRVGETFLKVDVDHERTAAEVEAMRHAPIPTPTIVWHQPPVLALAALAGRPLGKLGHEDTSSAKAWSAAGAAARRLHEAPLPARPGSRPSEVEAHADHCGRWIVDHGVADASVIDAVGRQMAPALRDFPLAFIHGDLQPAHVFVDDEDEVSGVIDWADSCQGDALFDLAVLTVGHGERLDDVVAGYGTDVDRDVIRGWWAFRRLASVPWMIEHGYDASGDVEALRLMGRA